MRMSTVRLDKIGGFESGLNIRAVLVEAIYANGACNGFNSSICNGQLVAEPSWRNDAIGVGISEPATVQRIGRALQRNVGGYMADGTHNTGTYATSYSIGA
jgi:hypothetical protein